MPLYFVTVSPQILLNVVIRFKTTIACRRLSRTANRIVPKSLRAPNSVFSLFLVALQTTRPLSRAQVRDNVEFLEERWNTSADKRHGPISVWWSDAESLRKKSERGKRLNSKELAVEKNVSFGRLTITMAQNVLSGKFTDKPEYIQNKYRGKYSKTQRRRRMMILVKYDFEQSSGSVQMEWVNGRPQV